MSNHHHRHVEFEVKVLEEFRKEHLIDLILTMKHELDELKRYHARMNDRSKELERSGYLYLQYESRTVGKYKSSPNLARQETLYESKYVSRPPGLVKYHPKGRSYENIVVQKTDKPKKKIHYEYTTGYKYDKKLPKMYKTKKPSTVGSKIDCWRPHGALNESMTTVEVEDRPVRENLRDNVQTEEGESA